MDYNQNRKDNIDRMKVDNPHSEYDYVRNKFIEKLKSFILPSTLEVKHYATKPKYYGADQEKDLKNSLRSLYDIAPGKVSESSQLIMAVLKEAIIDEREKGGQRINSTTPKAKAKYNKPQGFRYQAWERLLDFAYPRMKLDSKSKIDFLNFMFKFNVNCGDDCYKFFADYKVNGDYDTKLNEKIFDYVNFRLSRPAANRYAGVYSAFLESYAENTQKFDLNSLERLTQSCANTVNKADDFEQRFDFGALETYLKRRAQKHPNPVEQELFGKVRLCPDLIDKKGVMVAAKTMVALMQEPQEPSSKLAEESCKWLAGLVKNYHFRQSEIDDLKQTFDPEKALTTNHFRLFSSLNNELQVTYNLRQNQEIKAINDWACEIKTDDKVDLLSVRSTYVNLLTEKLICDNDISKMHPEAFYRSHRALVRRQPDNMQELSHKSERCDGPKIDNLRMVMDKKYAACDFYPQVMDILDSLDSNHSKAKSIKMPMTLHDDRYL